MVGVEGENRNKLGACQFVEQKLGAVWIFIFGNSVLGTRMRFITTAKPK